MITNKLQSFSPFCLSSMMLDPTHREHFTPIYTLVTYSCCRKGLHAINGIIAICICAMILSSGLHSCTSIFARAQLNHICFVSTLVAARAMDQGYPWHAFNIPSWVMPMFSFFISSQILPASLNTAAA